MAVTVTHAFVSPVADAGNPDAVGPDEWNAAHTVNGLGTAAEADSTDFATAAQGATADTAVQPGDLAAVATTGAYSDLSGTPSLATVATTGAYSDLSGLPTLGTAAAADTGDFATAAQGTLADSALQAADIGVSVQAYDADLSAWAGVNPSSYSTSAQIAAAYQPLDADLTAWAAVNPSSYSTTAQIAAAYQPLDSDLTAIAGLSRTRGDIIRGGASAWERYALGTAGYALKSDGTDIVYAPSREVLTTARTYYVRTDGSDSNNGLANTSGGAFLTLQKAWDTIAGLDLSTYAVTISVADGTYTSGINMNKMPVGGSSITIQGNTGTPANVLLSIAGSAFTISAPLPCSMTITGFKATLTGSGRNFIHLAAPGTIAATQIENGGNGSGFGGFYQAEFPGALIVISTGQTISGSGAAYVVANAGGRIQFHGITVTLTGTPAFSWVFAVAVGISKITAGGVTFSGSATGIRYSVSQNSVIDTSGGGASYFPGDVGGSASSGGQYL